MAQHAVGHLQRSPEPVEQIGRTRELDEVVLGVLVVIDLVGEVANAPVVLGHDLAALRDRPFDRGEDLRAAFARRVRVEQDRQVVYGGFGRHGGAGP